MNLFFTEDGFDSNSSRSAVESPVYFVVDALQKKYRCAVMEWRPSNTSPHIAYMANEDLLAISIAFVAKGQMDNAMRELNKADGRTDMSGVFKIIEKYASDKEPLKMLIKFCMRALEKNKEVEA